MTKLSSQVATFMAMVKQDLPATPTIPGDKIVRLRLRLVLEEAFELVESCCVEDKYNTMYLSNLRADVFETIDRMKVTVDLPEYADAIADIMYVAEGAYLAAGINGDPVADEVQRSNLAKLGGDIDANGKARKPAGWTPPDIRGELIKQGWSP